jgi:hypothetical protein
MKMQNLVRLERHKNQSKRLRAEKGRQLEGQACDSMSFLLLSNLKPLQHCSLQVPLEQQSHSRGFTLFWKIGSFILKTRRKNKERAYFWWLWTLLENFLLTFECKRRDYTE